MISYRRLQPTQFEEWIEHCANVFSANSDEVENYREYFRRHFLNDPWRDMSTIFVAMDADKIVGTVRLFKRKVNLDNQVISMGGIGEVSVNKDYQNNHIASNLMNLVNEEMIEEKINVSFLFASRFSFYNRSGYLSSLITYYKNEIKTDKIQYKFRKASSSDAIIISEIYDQYSKNINGTIIRNQYYWENWVKDEMCDLYLVLDSNDQVVAYISGFIQDENVVIKEYGEIKELNQFSEIANYYASNYYKNVKYIAYPSMFHFPVTYFEKKELKHLMVKLVTKFDDRIKTTAELVEHLNDTRSGYYQTDNF